jgi:BASS family bile acid:Na+ symporter
VQPGLLRTLALFAAMLVGAAVPQAHAAAGAIRWLVVGMLFLVFLQVRVTRTMLHRSHGWLLIANLGLGLAGWGAGWLIGGREVALATFFAGIAPTAAAAPVVMSFLRGRVDYVVASFVLTHVAVAATMPVLLPVVLGHVTPEAFGQVLGSVSLMVFAPAGVAWLLRRLHPAAAGWPAHLRNVSFGAWVLALFLTTANASDFLRRQTDVPRHTLFTVAGAALLVCTASFALGRLIGGRDHPREASQSLGQKNTNLTIWLALAYASPLVALGPTFYVLWHNLWNSWQLHRHRHHEPPG